MANDPAGVSPVVCVVKGDYTCLMPRWFKFVLILTFVFSSLHAQPAVLTYGWKYLEDVQGFGAYVQSVLDQDDQNAERLFGEVMRQLDSFEGSPYGSDIAKAKAIWFMARYLCNQVPKPSDRIASLIELARAAVESARLHAAPQAMLAVVETQLESLRYQATGSLTHALGTARMIDRTYRDHSEDVAAIVLKAEKLLYAPAIGGGNPREALSLYAKAWNQAQTVPVCTWDAFSISSGLGMALHERSDVRAIDYLRYARSLYSGDPVINEVLEKLETGEKP